MADIDHTDIIDKSDEIKVSNNIIICFHNIRMMGVVFFGLVYSFLKYDMGWGCTIN